MKLVARLAAAAAFAMSAFAAAAQTYPDRTITIVVPFAAGGPTDTVTRLVAESMSKDLGQQIIVENVGGAGGTLGAGRVAKAEPDGYTLLAPPYRHGDQRHALPQAAYDTLNAFEYVGLVTDVPMTIVGRKDFEPTDLKGLVEYVKANKDKVTLANAGIGAASHLCGMLFMSAIETPLTTVPYKGTGPAMTDLLGGQVDIMCDQTTNTTKQIKGGTIKAYAVTSANALDVLPDVPTAEEAGLPGFQVGVWHGLYAPKGTPAEVTERLSKSLQVALEGPQRRRPLRRARHRRPSPKPRPRRRRSRPSSKARSPAGSRSSTPPASTPTDGSHAGPSSRIRAIAERDCDRRECRCIASVRARRIALGDAARDSPKGLDDEIDRHRHRQRPVRRALRRLRRCLRLCSRWTSTSAPRSAWARAISRWCWPAILILLGADRARRRRSRVEGEPVGPIAWRGMLFILPAPVLFGLTVRGLGFVPALFLTALIAAFASHRMKPRHGARCWRPR